MRMLSKDIERGEERGGEIIEALEEMPHAPAGGPGRDHRRPYPPAETNISKRMQTESTHTAHTAQIKIAGTRTRSSSTEEAAAYTHETQAEPHLEEAEVGFGVIDGAA